MNIHSKKISSLQSTLSEERTNNQLTNENYKIALEKVEQLKHKITDLENIKSSLGRQVDQLTNDKMETEQDYKAKLVVKNTEIEAIRLDLEQERHKYEDILSIKQAMDAEIAIYKALLDGEENRVTR